MKISNIILPKKDKHEKQFHNKIAGFETDWLLLSLSDIINHRT